ncbi:MAG: phosphatase PAP2 family protein [Chloroflexi bacterium]|nr:phosphatase PAP2 family protein [Chloroflexota bacterium]
MTPGTLTLIGLVLFAVGWLHRVPAIARWDERVFMWLHKPLRRALPLFRRLWHIGTLRGLFVGAGATALFLGWRRGVAILVAYGIVVLGEMTIKRWVGRPRPYETLPDAQMGQPRKPVDSSFPSGDALRAWLLALTLAAWLPAAWFWPLLIIASAVSLGRIALGVHHPLDVISGTGLGFIAAALALWLAAWL